MCSNGKHMIVRKPLHNKQSWVSDPLLRVACVVFTAWSTCADEVAGPAAGNRISTVQRSAALSAAQHAAADCATPQHTAADSAAAHPAAAAAVADRVEAKAREEEQPLALGVQTLRQRRDKLRGPLSRM